MGNMNDGDSFSRPQGSAVCRLRAALDLLLNFTLTTKFVLVDEVSAVGECHIF